MKYRLKDQETQKKLDDLTQGEFSKRLDEIKESDFLSDVVRIRLGSGNVGYGSYTPRFTFAFTRNELEDAYDPRTWNKYPDIKPPVGIWMRTEYVSRVTGETIRTAARYEEFEGNYYWFDELDFETEVDRFRPWED